MRPLILVGVFITLVRSAVFCQVPQTLSYQGLLTDNAGVPLADGNYSVTFRFYDVATGGTPTATRGPLTVTTFKGLFSLTLGDGTTDNAALPFSLGDAEFYVGLTVSPSTTELSPRVKVTAVPYAFVANSVRAVDAATISTGTLSDARLSTHLQDLADGTLTGSKVGTGIDAANITTGTLAIARISDGAITANKIANATLTPAKLSQPLTLGTAVNTNGGTAITVGDIPSWVSRIQVIFAGVSTNGTSNIIIQIGNTGGIETTGYSSTVNTFDVDPGSVTSTVGFLCVEGTTAAYSYTGSVFLNRISGNLWVATVNLAHGSGISLGAGSKTLSGTLTQLSLTTAGGTNTFDAGQINIIYE